MKWPRLILALSLLISLYPLTAQAATTLSVSPGSVQTEIGKTFSVNININAGEAINAASGTVSYPTAILDVSSISLSGSIFSFWTDTPSSGSSITFGGGLPNPGHVGSGKLFSITFKAKAAGSGTISITNGKVLANNGSGSNVFSSASSSSVSVGEQLAGLSISSSSHPSQSKWYKTRQLILNWSKPSDVTNFEYSLSGPTSKNDSTAGNSVTFNDLEDGVWTFKLTGKSKKGDRSATFKAQIDNVAPEKFTVEVKSSGKTDPFPILIYSATDALSGIDRYEIVIGNSEAKTTTETTYKTERQTPGKKTVKVIAYDKAGNSTEATTEFEIEGFPGPVITDYSRFVSVLQPVELKGKALFEARIDLYVNGKKEAEFMVKDNLIDPSTATNLKDGDEANWVYTYKGTLLPGKHSFYATQTKPDSSLGLTSRQDIFRAVTTKPNCKGNALVCGISAYHNFRLPVSLRARYNSGSQSGHLAS